MNVEVKALISEDVGGKPDNNLDRRTKKQWQQISR